MDASQNPIEIDTGVATSIQSVYQKLSSVRQIYLDRARENAKYTIPSLIPPDDSKNNGQKLPQPANSIGARGVNNLASKLLVSLFPGNAPMFRMVIDDFDIQLFMAKVGKEGQGEIQKALNKIERSAMQDVDSIGARTPVLLALQHLLVAGNYLLFFDPDSGQCRGYPLAHFVCQRDSMGNAIRMIAQETVAFVALPKATQDAIKAKDGAKTYKYDDEVTIYTDIQLLEDGRWKATQEACGCVIQGAGGFYPKDKCPWFPLRLMRVEGDDYGRSMVEDVFGDLITANVLREAITNISKTAAKVIFLVKPNSSTKPRVLTAAQAGDFVAGNPDDITALQLDKTQDFQIAQAVLQDVTRALEFMFLLQSAVTRNAERVTAEEVRQVIQELDTSLGGLHSALSAELQLPFVRILLWRMERKGKFKLPKGAVKPAIVTGVAALGRGQDRQNLASFFQDLASLQTVPPMVLGRIKIGELIARSAASNNVDTDGLIMSDEEFAAAQQQQQMMSLAQNAGPKAIQELTKGMVHGQLQENAAQGGGPQA